ncbi:sensor histidine kinase [Blastococcus sp. PRF04-17]|uniref:sensor histidine kinase n=1 Tax=Blastococcus sp. PRF04-17 TaxID=2933797 RepID=UPI001FF32552|nr:sensor histidine kinase [Blastococcus sp. PRF04-17]UOY02229.1 sensor histidine kinase [Blastococcus sp. PRF04-17]
MAVPGGAWTLPGAACGVLALLSPALLPGEGSAVLTAAALPFGFYAAGAIARALRPGHPVADRLLAVGTLHLAAIACAVVVARTPGGGWIGAAVGWASAVLFVLGFVAVLDLLARYPGGGYAWPWAAPLVRATCVLAAVAATVTVVADPRITSVLELPTGPNPAHVPALAPAAGAALVALIAPLAGLALLLARYVGAPELDRAQMRWPILTTAVLVVGLVTTGLAERVLGPEVQAALFVGTAALLPASFLVGLLRRAEQEERLAAVEESRARLAEGAVTERRRIERDLHDGAQQQLLALLARVELARARLGPDADAAVDRELREISAAVADVHRDLRELARGIHPAVLTDCGLGEAVRSALSRLPLQTELAVARDVERRRFPATVESAAYFVVLEGLSNVLKHAGSTAARVEISADGDALTVAVHDPGRGFAAPAAPGHGSGLLGLRDRVAAVGGSLEVCSRPGAGTTVRGVLPVSGRG